MSSRYSQRRLKAEGATKAKNLKSSNGMIINYGPISHDLFSWEAFIAGVPCTPYEGGVYQLSILIPPRYPFAPPKIRFLTKIYHACVDENGEIDYDFLKFRWWSPAQTIFTSIVSISSTLSSGGYPLLQCSEIAKQMKRNLFQFMRTAVDWNHRFANGYSAKNRQLLLLQPGKSALRNLDVVGQCIFRLYGVECSNVAAMICEFAVEYSLQDLPFEIYLPWIEYVDEQFKMCKDIK